MAELTPHIQFKIDKSLCLGRGAYAAVYRAEFDTLPCAAKLLHPILFQGGDPGAITVMERFRQEWEFLSIVRHPNIVQYLGICRDPDSEQAVPVLLMELLDESLTHFLEHSQQPLPFHLEVNLCHDVTLALAYLHSYGIIHRDLSSNNILLIAGSRAKVADFGMSRVLNLCSQATPSTLCPGTMVYMPPESLKSPPMFTDKLDCFSFGVLEIQIMTRQFPNPGPAVQEIEDQRSRIGRVQIPIPDAERRRFHINLIDSNHPLLPTAISCLSYLERERPSALDLCRLITALKQTPRYTQSVQQVLQGSRLAPRATAGIERHIQENQQQAQRIRQLQQQLAVRDNQIEILQREREAQNIQHSQQLQQQLAARDKTLQQRLERRKEYQAQQQQELQQQLAAREKELETLQQRLERRKAYQAQQQLTALEKQNVCENQELQQQVQTLRQQLLAKRKEAQQLRQELQRTTEVKERQLQQLKEQLEASEQIVAQLEQANDRLTQELERPPQGAAQAQATVQHLRDPLQQEKTTLNISWQKGNDAPETMSRGSTTSQGELVYFNPMGSTAVHVYNSRRQQWSRLPDCPHTSSAVVIVKGRVTAVGGKQRSEPTNALLSLAEEGTGKNWIEYFPPMPTKRFSLAAVCIGRDLVAAGGQCGSVLRTVEVLNVDSQQWSIASPLPHPCCRISQAVWENKLYLLSGFNCDMNPVRSVLTCSMPELLQSCQSPENPVTSEQPKVWCQISATPFFNSTCATIRGRLLAIGGNDATGKDTKSIHVYNPLVNAWRAMRDMPTARHSALVAILLGDRLMVVGGWGEQRVLWNKEPAKIVTVEFCTFS